MIQKEKNWLVFEDEEARKIVGKIDINSCKIYGKSGKEIKTCSSEMNRMFKDYDGKSPYVRYITRNGDSLFSFLRTYGRCLSISDRMLNVGIKEDRMPYIGSLKEFTDNELSRLLKDKTYIECINNGTYLSRTSFRDWEAEKALEPLLNQYTLSNDRKRMLKEVYQEAEKNLKYIKYILDYILSNESIHMELNWSNLSIRYDSYDSWGYRQIEGECSRWKPILVNYYYMTKITKREWEKKNWINDLRYVYMAYHNFRIASHEEFFRKHSDPEILSFDYGNFEVVVPEKGQDLIEEGQKMHHCVGSYVGNVESGACCIVFVRKKNEPETPYITCEIRPSGRIGQYYLAYDRMIKTEEDCIFRERYQDFLYSRAEKITEMLGRV